MQPRVSFLLPVYNEQRRIGESLRSLAAQDYPRSLVEVVVADGGSTDGTATAIEDFRRRHPDLDLRIVANPSRNTAVGRNLALKHATGQLVLNYSGHAVADGSLVRVLVEKLAAAPEDVAGVGCAIRTPPTESIAGRAIAAVMTSRLAGGGRMDSSFAAADDCDARSLAFVLYRRDAVDQVGGFDAEFWCGQDAELNLRLAEAGYRLRFTPDTSVTHYKRTSLGAFARQMFQYGVARAKIMRKHPRSVRGIFLLPALWVAALVAAAVGSVLSLPVAMGVGAAAIAFAVVNAVAMAAAGGGVMAVLLSPVVLATLYTAYGLGFWRGLARWPGRRGRV